MRMNNRMFASVLCFLMIVCCAFALTACDGDGKCAHQWGQWVETKNAACTEAGLQERKCSKCGEVETSVIEALGHTPGADDGDCTTAITCSVCGEVTTAANASHIGGTATSEQKAKCSVCGKEYGEFAGPNTDVDIGSKVTITFYHTMNNRLQDVLDRYIAEFNQLYPNITVIHISVGSDDDVYEQIQTEMSVGFGPNIAYCYPEQIAKFNQSGLVVGLDDLIASTAEHTDAAGQKQILGLTPNQISNYITGFYEEGRQFGDGQMYCLPMTRSTEVMYYDKTFFEAHGLKVPATWDEMEDLCKRILEIDPNCTPFAYDSESNWFITMCAQYGSDYTSATGEHYLFNNATNRDFVARFRQWYQKGYFTTYALYGDYTSELFTSTDGTRCYMTVASTSDAKFNRPDNAAFEVGIASIPQVNPDNPKVISQGPSLCILRNENPQEVIASWLFVKFLTTNVEFQAGFSMASGDMPVIQSVKEDPAYAQWLGEADGDSNLSALAAKAALEQFSSYFATPAFSGSSEARNIVGELMTNAMCVFDFGNSNMLIENLFKDAVTCCKNPSADSLISAGIRINGAYVTDTEHSGTNSSGATKRGLGLSNNKNDAQALTVIDNGDGTVSFRLDHGGYYSYLYCDAKGVSFFGFESEYTQFVLEKVDGGYYIRCAFANDNGKPQYLEAYKGYLTCDSISSTSDLSLFTFKLENIH